ncbi:hypothetical protein [Streptomyces sp. NPDC093094]|uniref:hypothetical protein n=1 Tax=Streptomyces sp. NPDC093094 TaxID=3366026 RepID=UPI00381E6A44
MTPSTFRGRPRRARGRISVRVAHAVLGAAAGLMWLVLAAPATGTGVTGAGPAPVVVAQEPGDDSTATADLVLPLIAAAAASALAAYGYLRRTRRARTPATPRGAPSHDDAPRPAPPGPAAPPDGEPEERCLRALVAADDSVRTSVEELAFARSATENWSTPAGPGHRASPAAPASPETGNADAEPGRRAGPAPTETGNADTETGHRAGRASPETGSTTTEPGHRAAPAAPASPETGNADAEPGRRAGPASAETGSRAGPVAVGAEDGVHEPFGRAVAEAEEELAAAFRIRQRYDEGVPEDPAARRHALAGIVGRCGEAGRRLDAQAAAFDALRDLEGAGLGPALEVAEGRFRQLAGRTAAAEAVLGDLAVRFPPAARAPVTGYTEQAKDRLVFATTRLNQARQSADLGGPGRAAAHLRAAEAAITQAAVLLNAVHRVHATLAEAADLVPAALTGAERLAAGVRSSAGGPPAEVPAGELRARVARLDRVLAGVREESAAGVYDPVEALRRIVLTAVPLGGGRDGVLGAASRLVARESVADAAGFVATHRGAVGAQARTRLAEARRLLAADPDGWPRADELARRARQLAEQDVRVHGHPLTEAHAPGTGLAGAVLGGVLLGDPPGTPASFGGPDTRGRRTTAPPP